MALTEDAAPRIDRTRHEIKRRNLTVSCVERITPAMIRVHLEGPDLADFPSLAFDDHCKVIVTDPSGEIAMRDYTPRRFDREACTLLLDFAVHEAGPATAWAMRAEAGDSLTVGGPRGSRVIGGDVGHWVLIGDETALPAIGRFLEEAPSGTEVTVLVAVTGPEEEQVFDTRASAIIHWLHRPSEAAADPASVISALRGIALTPRSFVWTAAESRVSAAVRAHVTEECGHPLEWTKSSGYWTAGKAQD